MIVSDERVARFVSDRLGFALCPPYTALGIERDGEICAGAIFNHFEGNDVHIGIVGTGWTRGFLRAVGEYVFSQLGCGRMTAITESPKVIGIVERLGGQMEGCLREHFGPGRDGFVAGILKSEWRY